MYLGSILLLQIIIDLGDTLSFWTLIYRNNAVTKYKTI